MAFGKLDGVDLAIINILAAINLAMWFIDADASYVYRCCFTAAIVGYIVAASKPRK